MALQGNGAVFSSSRLLRLAEDVESDAIAVTYATMFVQMLPERVGRILSTVRQEDLPAALDAVLSLKVRAHMAGGLAMERDCRILEENLRKGEAAAAAQSAREVASDCLPLTRELEQFIRGWQDQGGSKGGQA
ncbi:hypothetical protein B1A87_001090 [Arthrobacter sp. KBS0703]|uniref:hypothetical protein n=1 Tax=Bacteria TaxID=2 RepID=UPI00098FCF60|nr:hypothetical protein [Arthrobacter sp. KBS0703]TSE14740.1 hypothetical protein B1A87_001090 [Arthrobacter sp. KBS0703]